MKKKYIASSKDKKDWLDFTKQIGNISPKENDLSQENIEIKKVLDDISFTATDRSGEKIIIDENYVTKNLGELAKDTDLSKFIL